MKRILLLLLFYSSISFGQLSTTLTKSGFYIYTPITGSATISESGIFINNSQSKTKVSKSDTTASKLSPIKWSYVSRYEHNLEDLSDSALTVDSTNTFSRLFDLSMYPMGTEFIYRYAIVERKLNGINFYKSDTAKTYIVEEVSGALYDSLSYPLFDSEGNLLYPSE